MNSLKKLDLPYVGIKIESLPTILNVLKNSKTNQEFCNYFILIGKTEKTALEYLRSLRNLKLANKNSTGETIINSYGLDLLNNDIGSIYKTLLEYCMKRFTGVKILTQTVKTNKFQILDELIAYLKKEGYEQIRKATLSSYFKLINEVYFKRGIEKKPVILKGDTIEYQQFKKLIFQLDKLKLTNNLVCQIRNDLKINLNVKVEIKDEVFHTYLESLQRENFIKMYAVNSALAKMKSNCEKIGNIYYYNFEVINNG